MPNTGPNTPAHPEWLGFIQPNGMAVSAPALVKAGAILNRQDAEGQARLAGCVEEREFSPVRGAEPCLQDFRGFATAVLDCGFSPKGCADTKQTPGPDELGVPRPDYCETLGTDFAVRERAPRYGSPPWQLLVQVLDDGQEFDQAPTGARGLEASPQCRADLLLRGAETLADRRLGFSEDEQRQHQADVASWRQCLTQFDRDTDTDTEPARIRAFYEVRAQRVEPVGLVYLWPNTG